MENSNRRMEGEVVLTLYRSNVVLGMIREHFSDNINTHTQKELDELENSIETLTDYEDSTEWLFEVVDKLSEVKRHFRCFEQIATSVGDEQVKLIMALSESQLHDEIEKVKKHLPVIY